MRFLYLALTGGALAGVAAVIFANKKAEETKKATVDAVDSGGMFVAALTGYWPFSAKSSEKKMEGGVFDRKMNDKYKDDPSSETYKKHVLRTVEDFFAGKAEFVSLSADDSAFPYGQMLIVPWTNGREIKGRVVDTGEHFRGTKKVYRFQGREPIDCCVDSSKTEVPKGPITVRVVKGDHWDKKVNEIVVSKLKGQDMTVGSLHMLGAC